jgi:hypothetical protein
LKPRDDNLAKKIMGGRSTPPDVLDPILDAPAPGIEGNVTSRQMQRIGWANVNAEKTRARAVTAHTYRRHKQVVVNCQLCANQVSWWCYQLARYFEGWKKKTIEELFR